MLERTEYYRKKAERNLYLLTSQSLYSEYLILGGEYDKALLVSLKGLLNSPWFFRLQIDLGLSYLLKNELNSAKEELNHALKIDPENPIAYFFLALTYVKMDRLIDAEAILESGFDYNPDKDYIKDLLIHIYRLQGKNIDNISSDFISIEKKVKEGFISSSNVLKIKEERGNKLPYEVLYAISLIQEDKLKEATSVLEKILIYHPYYPKALYTLGEVYSIIGDRERKEENWRKAFEVNPLLPELEGNIGEIESVHIDKKDLPEMKNLENLIIKYTLERCEIETKEEMVKDEFKEEEVNPVKLKIEEEREETPKPTQEVSSEKKEGVEHYKEKGVDYLKKKMYKEAIEMFIKALKERREKI